MQAIFSGFKHFNFQQKLKEISFQPISVKVALKIETYGYQINQLLCFK